MEVAVLGPLEVRVDGVMVRLAAAKERALLAVLATRPGLVVSTGVLVDALWGDDPPTSALKALHTYVSSLRKQLPADSIVTVPDGYRADLNSDAVDALVFERLVAAARVRAREAPQDAAGLLVEALGLWRGVPLIDLADHAFGISEATRLTELQKLAEEDLVDVRLAAGEHRELIGELEAAVSEEPLCERRWGQLITALYRCGRQADALRAYQRLRATLADELGVDPSPALKTLESAVLTHDPGLDLPPWVEGQVPPCPLPSGTVTFLFTDLEGSSAEWDRDETGMDLALARHDQILRDAIAHCGGYVFSVGGDGLAAAFSRAQDALAAAVAAQRALCAERWPEPIHISARMGMHTGEAVERDGNYFGPAVIRASRLMSSVGGGRIVCSLATEQLVRSHLPQDLELVPVGTVALRGLSLSEQVFAVGGVGLPEMGERLESATARGVSPPRALARLVGRAGEVHAIGALLSQAWLVTLTGVGGVGKTRLAMAVAKAVADKFPDGTYWAELATVAQPADTVQAVADALAVRSQPGQPLITTVCDALLGRRALLVLDNCEHVRAAAAELAATIGQHSAEVTLLVTSRERLGVEGEQAVLVPRLAAGRYDTPAVELLVERIDNPESVTPDDEATLVEIAQRVEGLPLALELAAARCRSLGVAEVAARLGNRFDLLADRTRPTERHRTLEAAMAWSYDLLTPVEQQVLQRLSVFAGSFTLGGAEQVTGLSDLRAVDVDDAVASLVDKSLVARDDHRFRLLETTRQFATERLAASGHAPEALDAHCAYLADRAGAIRAGLNGPDELLWVTTLDAEWPDVRAAVRHAFDIDHADAITSIIVHLAFEFMYRRPEAFSWVTDAVSRYGERPSPHRHELLGAGALVAFTSLDIAGAVQLGERAMAADPAPGTAISCLPQLASLGAYVFAGQFERAARLAEHTATLLGPCSEPLLAPAVLTAASVAALGQGSVDQAAALAAKAVVQAEASGNASSIAYALGIHALTLAPTDPAAAKSLVHRAQAIASQVRNQWMLMLQAPGLAMTSGASSHDEHRLAACLQAIDTLHHSGRLIHAWFEAWTTITILFEMGRRDEAALMLGGCNAALPLMTGVAAPLQDLPHELAAVGTAHGERRLTELFEVGSRLPLPELTQIAAGKGPLPPLTGPSITPPA